jgi:predicted HAD superfamily Cof-like phosphohydrolase
MAMSWLARGSDRISRHAGHSLSQRVRRKSNRDNSASRTSRPAEILAAWAADRPKEQGFQRSDIAMAVAQFHASFGLPRRNSPTMDVPADLVELRVGLLAEEVDEFAAASAARDLVEVADALADLVYVAYGSAVTYGIDLDAVLAEVHRSNMSKLDADGRPVLRPDGKVLKSDRYTPPDVAGVLRQQSPLPW